MRQWQNCISHYWKATNLITPLRVTTKTASSPELHQCKNYFESRVLLWGFYTNTYCSPTADRQFAVSLFIFRKQPAISFEKEATAHFAKQSHSFSGQCSAACSRSCGWFGWSMGMGNAVPCTTCCTTIPKLKEPLRGILFRIVPELLQAFVPFKLSTQQALINLSYNFHIADSELYAILVTTPKDSNTW